MGFGQPYSSLWQQEDSFNGYGLGTIDLLPFKKHAFEIIFLRYFSLKNKSVPKGMH